MNAETSLIPGKKHAPVHLGRVLIVGLGKSGMAAVEYCAALLGSRVDELVVSAGKPNPKAQAFVDGFAGTGITFRFEYEDIQGPFDLCIVSPGISDMSALYRSAKAASADMVSELEFAWRESAADSRWIAITGTNGKTTTTSLVTHIAQRAGLRASAVGNIGEVALTRVWQDPQDLYVAEISSFQLATCSRFAPDVAVLLNITPDHLEWHGSMERYIEAKARVLAHLDDTPGTAAVLDCTNDVVAGLYDELHLAQGTARIVRMVEPADLPAEAIAGLCDTALLAGGELVVATDEVAHLGSFEDLQIKGEHNVLNALAAASAALLAGIPADKVAVELATFAPLEHRIEPCGSADGVSYFNDSKGTNVDATCKAFTAFTPGSLICLLGGHDKGTDLTPLVEGARKTCRAVVCYGEARERFLEAFGAPADLAAGECITCDGLQVYAAAGMRDATRLAAAKAHAGESVLLSPACSSYDEFTGYEERGRVFKDLVAREICHVN